MFDIMATTEVILALFTVSQVWANPSEIVYTTGGPIQGEVLKTVSSNIEYQSFKGIPYAKPPLGDLRYKPPVKADSWMTLKQTVEEQDSCIQYQRYLSKLIGSEDCLYLNVYTPQVWIFGGSNVEGTKNSGSFGPDFLIDNDVVVVAMNYRLGALGFLSLDHPEALGNAGYKDQNLALRWVNENIANFCGDPKKVTLFGQSSGGVAVDFHMLSEMSKGLFHRSISMSASPYCDFAFSRMDKAKETAYKLGKVLNNGQDVDNDEELLAIYKKAPAGTMVLETRQFAGLVDPPFKAVLESANINPTAEKFLTKCYFKKYATGNYSKMPHMQGFTKYEALLLGVLAEKMASQNDLVKGIRQVSRSLGQIPIIKDIVDVADNVANDISVAGLYRIVNYQSDKVFKTGIDLKQREMTKSGDHPIYYYEFAYDAGNYSYHYRDANDTKLHGASHEDDLSFIFYRPDGGVPLHPYPKYELVSKQMTQMWTNFAKFGYDSNYFVPEIGLDFLSSL